MSKSLLQTANIAEQIVADGGVVNPGVIVRRYGPNANLNGNAQTLAGAGYYELTGAISVAPTAAGEVQVALQQDGVNIPGAFGYATTTAADQYVTIPLVGTVRLFCDQAAQITCVLISGAGTVSNYSLRVEK